MLIFHKGTPFLEWRLAKKPHFLQYLDHSVQYWRNDGDNERAVYAKIQALVPEVRLRSAQIRDFSSVF